VQIVTVEEKKTKRLIPFVKAKQQKLVAIQVGIPIYRFVLESFSTSLPTFCSSYVESKIPFYKEHIVEMKHTLKVVALPLPQIAKK
jgi:hypothetical protein